MVGRSKYAKESTDIYGERNETKGKTAKMWKHSDKELVEEIGIN